MPPNILKIAKRHRAEIDRADAANLRQVAKAYAAMYDNLTGDVEALRLAIEAIESPTVAQIKALSQYKRLLSHGKDELDRFTVYLETTIQTSAVDAVGLGLSHSKELVSAMLQGRFGGLNTNVVAPLLNYLRRDGPLFERIAKITYATSAGVTDAIIKGVGLGYNPRKIASQIQDAFGGGLTDALRNTRTVQLYAYRDSARANYMATDGIVTGVIRYEELDSQTCAACWAEHGVIRGLDEPFEGHYNCRGADLPYIEGLTDNVTRGEDMFNALSEAEQRNVLGSSKYDALKAGKFEFSQLSKVVDNEVFGNMRVETPLKDLIGDSTE